MSADQPDAPRIIVDDDWKERVQAEKEALDRQRGSAAPTENDMPPVSADRAPPTAADDRQEPRDHFPPVQPPPASFEQLVVTLAAQASYALADVGGSPDQVQRQLAWVRYFVDTLHMLEAKTQGQLDAEESHLLASVLYELRMACVETQTRLSSAQTGPRP